MLRHVSLLSGLALLLSGCGSSTPSASTEDRNTHPDAGPTTITAADIQPLFEHSAVFIVSEVPDFGGTFIGSGVVLDDTGTILTNNHVVEGTASLKVRIPGKHEFIDAKIVGRSPCDDLAVIQVSRNHGDFKKPVFGDSTHLVQGARVYSVGFPADPASEDFTDTPMRVTEGLVGVLGASFNEMGLRNCIQHDATINHGNSGGPLVDEFGAVVGINTLGFFSAGLDNTYYAIAMDEAQQVYPQLLKGTDLNWLGVSLYPNSPAFAKYNIPTDYEGMVIAAIDTNSQLYKAPYSWFFGDVLQTAAGKPLKNMGDLCDVMRTLKQGDQFRIEGMGQATQGGRDYVPWGGQGTACPPVVNP